MIRIGVDIGGTKMAIAALDESGAELFRRRSDAPNGAYADALRALANAVLQAEREAGRPCTVGIGTPGAVSAGGVLRNAFASVLNGRPLKPDLERLLGREVRFANDANCFALSEAADGAAAGAGVVFGVILGTGVGGGVVVGGHALEGRNAIAGEWGHNALPWIRADELPGPPCGCGKPGHIEGFLSGPGLARDYQLAAGAALEPAQIVARAESGDAACEAALARYEERLERHQPDRPGRDRARRRPVERGAPVPQRAEALGTLRVLGCGRDAAPQSEARRRERGARRGAPVVTAASPAP
jgi:fructokinase